MAVIAVRFGFLFLQFFEFRGLTLPRSRDCKSLPCSPHCPSAVNGSAVLHFVSALSGDSSGAKGVRAARLIERSALRVNFFDHQKGRSRMHTSTKPVRTFPLGRILITPGAIEALEEAGQMPNEFLDRHARCDWGNVDEHDRRENELSLEQGFRLLSAYKTTKGERLWIITEADRSATTILLPSEY